MKKLLYLCSIALILYLSLVIASAHPGRTDGNGGHNDHSNNSYHYHHGYGPHSHDNGFCPIEPENERYYTNFYKFKLFLNDIPHEYIYSFPIVVNILLALLFIIIIRKRRNHLFPELSFEEQEKVSIIQIQYFSEFHPTDFLGNITSIIVPLVLFVSSSILIDSNNIFGIIFASLLFTAFYVYIIYTDYRTSHSTIRTIHYSKKTISHIFDDINDNDYVEINPSDCYLPQHFQIKFIVFIFYIISLILFYISLVIRLFL